MTLLIQAAAVSYAHGGNRVLDGAQLDLRVGERVAIVGANGTGKSTLLRLLARDLTPSAGAVTTARGTTVGMLTQHASLDPALTARDAVAVAAGDADLLEAQARELEERMGLAATDDELTAILDAHAQVLERIERGGDQTNTAFAILRGLGIPESRWDTTVGSLSGGEKQVLALAALLASDPDVLLLDEPDNHLDFAAKAWLEEHLRARRGATAVISHDRWFIDRIATRIVELQDGKTIGYPGNYADYLTTKHERLTREAQLRELQEREFKKLKASSEQLTQWARQNPKFASRAENMRRKLEEERQRLEATPTPVLNQRQIDLRFDTERGSTLVLELDGLEVAYDGRTVLQPFDLTIRHGERVGIVGANGSGKTTLVRAALGTQTPTAGTVRRGPSVVVGYYAQEQETLNPNSTAMEVIRKVKPMTEQSAIGFLNGLLFTRDDMLNPIRNLSGGEKSRLQIAILIAQGANFLVLDEPTNNLDMGSIEQLESALTTLLDAGDGTLLTISHDRMFLESVCTRIIEVADGEVRDYPGSYGHFDRHRGTGTLLTRRTLLEPEPMSKKSGKRKQ